MRAHLPIAAQFSLALAIALLSPAVALHSDDASALVAKPAKLTGSIYGTVVDHSGKPIAGAEVRLHQWEAAERNYGPAKIRGISDAGGKFEFATLDDGNYVIAADSKGLATTRFDTILQDKSHQKFKIVLRPATTSIVKLQSPAGEPITGATLQELRFRNASGELQTSDQFWNNLGLQTGPSDAQGKLQLPPLPEGTILIAATIAHPDFAPIKIQEIEAASGIIATATMQPGARLRLVIDSAAAQEPISTVKLSLRNSDRNNPSEMFQRPVPVRDGAIELVMTPGEYDSIQLEHDQYHISPTYRAPDISQSIKISAEQKNEYKFELHKKVKVRGKVIDAVSHRPLKEAYVYAQVPNQPASDWDSAGGMDTNANGEFTLELPAGAVRLSVICDDYTLGKAFLDMQIADGAPTLPDVEMRKNPVISGRVVDPDGKPIAGAILRLQGVLKFMRHSPAATDSDGRFELPIRRVPENFDTVGVELAWKQPLEVFHPTHPLSTRVEVHLDQSESFSKMSIQLQPESAEELLRRAQIPTLEWERKLLKRRAELSEDKRDAAVGATPPELDGQLWLNAEGAAPTLASFRGKYVLLDFWTVWCGPCHADFPEVKLLHEAYKNHGLVVIGVHDNSVDANSVREHVQKQGLKFPIVVDRREGGILAAYKKIGLVTGYPSYVLIGPDGKVLPSEPFPLYKFETIRKHLMSQQESLK